MLDLRNFAYAAAKRYSGSFRPVTDGPPLPAVRHWIAWNEPNNPFFLKPQFTKIGRRKYRLASPGIYAKMCNSIWSGVHLTGFRGEKVACGATSPRGNNSGTLRRASLSPLPFLRGMKKAHARFDVYAHHPYYQHPNEPPNRPPPGSRAITLGNINELIRELTRLYGTSDSGSPSTATRRTHPTGSSASRSQSRRAISGPRSPSPAPIRAST